MHPRWSKFKPPINFVTIHYAYIIFMGLLSLVVLMPAGNLNAIDAYFFGASSSTESGLNTVDVKDLHTYQQLFLYFIPMFTNLGFINAFTVLVRLLWFRKHVQRLAPQILKGRRQPEEPERAPAEVLSQTDSVALNEVESQDPQGPQQNMQIQKVQTSQTETPGPRIAFDSSVNEPRGDSTLYVPGPRDRDRGASLREIGEDSTDTISIRRDSQHDPKVSDLRRRHNASQHESPFSQGASNVAHVAKTMLILDTEKQRQRNSLSREPRISRQSMKANAVDGTLSLSRNATIGRNSDFHNMSQADWERLGGIEYRSLKLLLKIVFSYFFGLHLFGAICIVIWIQYAPAKYTDYLESVGQDKNWWAFYSAQTMVDNLGFTLTPDSMISFRDAPWPMIIMSFLAFAGNTLYPVFLRLVVWTLSKIAPKNAAMQEPLSFLLNHPRRCYTLLFPSGPTWILFSIIFVLNLVDTLFIIVLDLDNPEVNVLPAGHRILAAIFQAASSRHTGTSTFNLANVSPAVQFSLMVMMYIAIFPIALSVRASNTYEEKSLGVWSEEGHLNESDGRSYIMTHLQNQLNFDLWYIFLGIFIICIAESRRIHDLEDDAFTVWTIFFEVVSAYGNVGLSLGYPTVMTSLSGMFSTISKLVICAMMIRGRHRGLPYTLDHAIMLPDENLLNLRREHEEV